MRGRHVMGRQLLVVAVVVASAVLTAASAEFAGAQVPDFERIELYEADLTIERDGGLLVRERIVYDFGPHERHGIYRVVPVRVDYPPVPNHDRVYPLDVLSVRGSPGTPAQYTVERESGNLRIKIGDPDRTITGTHTYEIVYRVRGALNGFDDHDELVWNAVGTDWQVPIVSAAVTVQAPAEILAVHCATGPYGSNAPCASAAASGDTASFTPEGNTVYALGPFEGMTVSVAIPKGVVPEPEPVLEERFTLGSAFRVTTATVGLAVGMLVLMIALVVALVWSVGRDRRYRGSPVDAAFGSASGAAASAPSAGGEDERVPLVERVETPVEFVPPDGVRPGQVGTLVDFAANPLDVTATIVDLAVRGYLVIEEIDKTGWFRSDDWKLTRTERNDDDLLQFERTLLTGLFRDGDEVELSDLHNEFASRMQRVRDALERDAVARGWFAGKPGARRVRYAAAGLVVAAIGIGVTIALAKWTHAGLLGLPVVLGGLVLFFASRWIPSRTAKGYAMLRRVAGFRRFIEESEKERARFAERQNLFSEYLPYAVVFGATKKWARAFAGLDGEPPDTSRWYVSSRPFDYTRFGGAISGFTVTSAGTLTSSPSTSGSSGFSGGGFSGGGGGGGGGGSW